MRSHRLASPAVSRFSPSTAATVSAAVAFALHCAAARADLEDMKSFGILPRNSHETSAGAVASRDGARFLLAQASTSSRREGAPQQSPSSGDPEEKPKPESEIEEVIVRGFNFNYNAVESANKMPLSIKDTPQSVKVITADVIDFASLRSFDDIYKVDASGMTAHSPDGFVRNYYRGFRIAYGTAGAVKVDGFRVAGNIIFDLAPFERLEIIKGSSSTLYGQAHIAGTLNAITKKPLAERGGSVALEGGSFDHYRADFDVHGALTGDESLTNVYANYGDTFVPQGAIGLDGGPLGPEEGFSYEVGVKGELPGGRFAWSAAAFLIERGPIAEDIPGQPGFSRLLGVQRAEGIELDAQGELLPGWDVFASFAVTDNQYVDGQFDGYPSPFGPKVGVSLYTSCELQGGQWAGFGVGGGVVHKRHGEIRPFFGPAAGRTFPTLFDDAA